MEQTFLTSFKILIYIFSIFLFFLTTKVYTKEKESDEATWPFDRPENIILNTAIGGNWGGSQGVDNSSFPLK